MPLLEPILVCLATFTLTIPRPVYYSTLLIVQSSVFQVNDRPEAQHRSHHVALTAARGLARVLRFLDFCDHGLERLRHIFVIPCAGFGEGTFEFLGQFATLVGIDLSLRQLKIALVADDDERDPVGALVKALAWGSRKDWVGARTRWLRILSRRMRIISKD